MRLPRRQQIRIALLVFYLALAVTLFAWAYQVHNARWDECLRQFSEPQCRVIMRFR
jgi:hypothetical protein